MRVQEFVDSPGIEQSRLRLSLPHEPTMPQVIRSKGLYDATRQWGLYDEIRQFTAERCQNITTPLPSVPKTRKRQVADVSSDSDDAEIPPPPNRGAVRGRGSRGRGVVDVVVQRCDGITAEPNSSFQSYTETNSSFQS